MNGWVSAATGATLLALWCPVPAAAQEAEGAEVAAAADEDGEPDDGAGFFVGGEVEFPSRYVWRGLAVSDGPALQPSAWAGAWGVTAWAWANLHLGTFTAEAETWEVDAGLNYAYEWEGLTAQAEFLVYGYPGAEELPVTGELNASLAVPRGPITLFTRHSVDVIEFPGAYFGELAFSLTLEPVDVLSLEWEFALGWGSAKFNEAYVGPATDAMNVARGGMVVQFWPHELLYLRARLETSALLDAELREATGEPVLFVAALAVGSEWAP